MSRSSQTFAQFATALPFLTPWAVGFALLTAWPFVASFWWSFTRYDLVTPPEPIGWENYSRLAGELVRGENFGQAVWNTAYYALVSVPLSIGWGVGLAVMLSWKVRGQAFFRALVFLPSIVPVVVASVLWLWLLDPQGGPIAQILNGGFALVGWPPSNWFKGDAEAAWLPAWLTGGGFGSKDALVLMGLWGVGNFVVIYLAAIRDVPQELYEAAELDGVTPARQFWHITLPFLTPVIFFNLVMGLIQAVQAFTQVYLTSEGTGRPNGSSLLLSLHVFLAAFQNLEMGYASAIAWLLFVVLLAATALLFRYGSGWVFYRGGAA